MPRKIRITAGSVSVAGLLNESRTATAIWNALPLEAFGSTWGQEIYFGIPVKCPAERPTSDVEAGELAYWVQGECLCVFFGPTPVSVGEKPVPASPVNRVGRVAGDFRELKRFRTGEKVRVEVYEEIPAAEPPRPPGEPAAASAAPARPPAPAAIDDPKTAHMEKADLRAGPRPVPPAPGPGPPWVQGPAPPKPETRGPLSPPGPPPPPAAPSPPPAEEESSFSEGLS